LEKIKTDRPEFLFAKNNLALAYFCLNRKKAAIRTSEAVLLIDETNIHANCNMALFLSESGRSDEADAYLKKVMDMQYELNDDIHKIAITLCELKRYEDAMSYLLQMKDYDPYDEKTLFYLAMTLYNTGRYNEAIKYLSDVCTLDPPGYVANYFIGMIKEIVQGEREFTEMGYMYQVPQEEVRRRIRYLNEKLKLDREQLEVIWRHDDTLADTLTWGLISGDAFIKKAMSEILASFNDARAEKILKRFLLCKNQPDEIKNDVFLSLKKMGAKEPYVSYIDGSIVEVRVGAYGFSTEELSKYCEKVYMRISEAIKEHCNGQIRLLKDCACLLELYIQKAEPEYVYGDVATLAAAIHHAALVRTGLLANAGEVAAYYQADQAELTALSAEIIETVDKE
ncbi:MAG: tetratricopeptide repeat protein, partial [Christensenellaceae bacterium]